MRCCSSWVSAAAATGSAASETGHLRSARASSAESCTARQLFFVMARTGWLFDLYVPFNSLPNVQADLMGMSERSDVTSRRKRVKVLMTGKACRPSRRYAAT